MNARWIIGLVGLASLSCSEEARPVRDIRRPLLADLGNEVFVPTYVELEQAAAELAARTTDLCDAPSADSLEAAQDAWWAARAPLKRNEILAFGPATDEPLRFGPKLDFWPARVSTIESVLQGDAALSIEAVATFGASSRGFPVLEYLLYQPELDLVEAFTSESRRCGYALALAGDLASTTSAARSAWDPAEGDYLSELTDAGQNSDAGAFPSIEAALGEIVNRLVFTVENVRGDKLGAPLGNRSGAEPQPDSAESRFSARSLEDARDNLRGVEAVCFGPPGASDEMHTLASYLERIRRGDLIPPLRDAFDASFAALDAIPEPLAVAVVDDPDSVAAATAALSELQRLIQVDVINAMGLTLTFNDNDGD